MPAGKRTMRPNPATAARAGGRGRKAGYSATSGKDAGLAWKIAQAAYGDAAITEGGKLAQDYGNALDFWIAAKRADSTGPVEGFPAFSEKNERFNLDLIAGKITSALLSGNAQLFREIADFLESKNEVERSGWRKPEYVHALNFIEFCKFIRIFRDQVPNAWRDLPIIRDMLKYERDVVPTAAEVVEFWIQSGTGPGEETSARRMAQYLGIQLSTEAEKSKRTLLKQ